jgi:hypothetical protein
MSRTDTLEQELRATLRKALRVWRTARTRRDRQAAWLDLQTAKVACETALILRHMEVALDQAVSRLHARHAP